MRILIALLLAFVLTGCASGEYKAQMQAYNDVQLQLMLAHAEALKEPLVSLQCPPAGCVIYDLKVGRPDIRMPAMSPPRDPTADNIRAIGSIISTPLNILTGAYGVGQALDGLTNMMGTTLSHMPAPTFFEGSPPLVVDPVVVQPQPPTIVNPVIVDPVIWVP